MYPKQGLCEGTPTVPEPGNTTLRLIHNHPKVCNLDVHQPLQVPNVILETRCRHFQTCGSIVLSPFSMSCKHSAVTLCKLLDPDISCCESIVVLVLCIRHTNG